MTENIKNKQNIAIRAIAISMGFVFFTGGWRRFYNTPAKHDIESPKHLANKLVEAAPGSPIEDIIHWVLYNPSVTEFFTYLFSTGEILAGAALMIGLLSRLAAFGSALMNVALMLIFGWMGYECLDEWTMAALGFAISVTVMMTGSGTYSVDHLIGKDFFAKFFTPKVNLVLVVSSVFMTIFFYCYYFDFIGDFKKRTNTHVFSIVAEQVAEQPDLTTLYVNAGGSSNPSYVKSITFTMPSGEKVVQNAQDIEVVREHFAPWSHSGKVVDGVMKMRLGARVDIKVPVNAVSASVDLIDGKDQILDLTYSGKTIDIAKDNASAQE